MPVDNTGLHYTTLEGFIDWVSQNFAGMVADDIPNSYDSAKDSALSRIKEALLHAEGEVDGYLKIRGYKIPIAEEYVRSINVLKIYAYDLAIYQLYGRRGVTKERYYKYTNAIRALENFSDGVKDLPDDPPKNKARLSSGNNLPSVFSSSSRYSANRL